jgi:hypothetical protein
MNMIMHDSRVAPCRLSTKFCQPSVPVRAARTSAPSTPNAAASVAVAQPTNIVPITAATSSAHGISWALRRSFAASGSGGSRAGCLPGLSSAQATM